MTYEQDKELRRLTYKAETLADLMEHADYSRRCEIEAELDECEHKLNRLHDQIQGVNHEVQSR